jgi:hypothetical protein
VRGLDADKSKAMLLKRERKRGHDRDEERGLCGVSERISEMQMGVDYHVKSIQGIQKIHCSSGTFN